MKLIKPKLKQLKPAQLIRYLPLATTILLLGLLGVVLVFLHRYFYQTITQAKIVLNLRTQISLSQVDLPLYEKVFRAWEAKKQFDPKTLEALRDPFVVTSESPATQEPSLETANQPPAETPQSAQ